MKLTNKSNLTKVEKIEMYYKCMSEKIKEPLYDLLQPDVLFTSQFSVYSNRDKMIDDIWPHVGQNKVRDLQIFGEGNKYMVKYTLTGQRNVTMSEYLEFINDKISRIEVYLGFKPTG